MTFPSEAFTKALNDSQGLLARGKRSFLHVERKKRLEALYAAYRKYSDLAQQDMALLDVTLEMSVLMSEIEQINEMLRELSATTE